MTAGRFQHDEGKQSRRSLAVALLLSLLLHTYIWLMAVLIDRAFTNGWLPAWLQPLVQPAQALLAAVNPPPPAPVAPPEEWTEIPLQFVEVDPALVTEQPPTVAKFTSTANTVAANPNPAPEIRPDPRVEGFKDDSLKTFDTRRPVEKPQPAQPKEANDTETVAAPVQAPKPSQEAREAREEKGVRPGETVVAKVDPRSDLLKPQEGQAAQAAQPAQEEKRPRYKKVAEARRDKGMLVGERMKLNGNVARTGIDSSLDVKASPFGDYNYRLVQAVQERWYQLLDERKFALERSGRAVIKFNLHADGSVSEVRTSDSTVGDTLSFLCELAVMQPAPFGKWPSEVRRLIGRDVFEVTFTFNYY
jgi:outer membrane biosynthesis protein TonB